MRRSKGGKGQAIVVSHAERQDAWIYQKGFRCSIGVIVY